MKSQFPGLSGSKHEPNAHCHITSGCWFICWRKQEGDGERERETGRVTETGAHIGQLEQLAFLFFRPHNEARKESLCIGLIKSYSSSAWHPGNWSGFALGLIFRPVEDSQSIRTLFRLHTTNFLDLPKKRREEREERENGRVIETGMDDIEGEMEGR